MAQVIRLQYGSSSEKVLNAVAAANVFVQQNLEIAYIYPFLFPEVLYETAASFSLVGLSCSMPSNDTCFEAIRHLWTLL